MIIFRSCQTVKNKFVDLKRGDRVSAFGANGKHYCGSVDCITEMSHHRDVIKNADLSSNFFRVSKVNGVEV